MLKKHVRPFLRQPSVSSDGSKITFSSDGDIWIAPIEGGKATRITAHSSVDTHPVFAPDDQSLAFASYRTGGGNIYLADLDGNVPPKRLTWQANSAPPQSWSPDSEWIYFTGRYDGMSGAICKVARQGGQPLEVAKLSFENFYNIAASPIDNSIAFCNNGDPWWRKGPNPSQSSDIWLMERISDSEKPTFRKLTAGGGRNVRPMWNVTGDGIYFLSGRSGAENIWFLPLDATTSLRPVTQFDEGRLTRPAIAADGSVIVFERDFQLWKLSIADGVCQPIELHLDRDEKRNPVNYYEYRSNISEFVLSEDHKKFAFSIRGNLFADILDKDSKKQESGPSFSLPASDGREEMVSWHPNSKEVFYVSDRYGDPQLFHYDFVTRTEKQLTNKGSAKYSPKVSPDGKWLAFLNGQDQIRLIDLASGKNRKFICDQLFISVPDPTDYEWSPDSQWIAFVASDQKFFSNLYVQKLGSKEAKQLTFLSNISAFNPIWTPDGKYLLFNSGHYRSEEQIVLVELMPPKQEFKEDAFQELFTEEPAEKPEEAPKEETSVTINGDENNGDQEAEKVTKKDDSDEAGKDKPVPKVEISFEGIKQRIRFLTDHRQNALLHGITPDSRFAIFSAYTFGEAGIWSKKLDPEKRYSQPNLISTSSIFGRIHFSKDGKKMYYLNGGRIFKQSLTGDGEKSGNASKVSVLAPITIDFHRDKKHIFDEAWRLLNAHFYDNTYHGADWKKVKRSFQPMVDGIGTRDELVELLNRMVGELNASHLGASIWRGSAPDSHHGLFFEQLALERDAQFKISGLLKDGPAALADKPPQEGEYLVAIDGVRLDQAKQNLSQVMHHKSGRKVALTLGKTATAKKTRVVYIKPVSAGTYRHLQYQNWKHNNLQYVDEKSKGRLGYVHIPAMSHSAYMDFLTDLDTEIHDREGVLIDIRFNGGGHIAPFILDVLSRKAYALSSWRGVAQSSDTYFAGSRILSLPTILITNEHSGSNAEVFSEGYRQLKLGKVVGKPTMGAVIWTSGIHLKDGISFRLPRFKSATLQGENTEGEGRPVDIDVDRHLSEDSLDFDSQLDAAVDQLLKDIDHEA